MQFWKAGLIVSAFCMIEPFDCCFPDQKTEFTFFAFHYFLNVLIFFPLAGWHLIFEKREPVDHSFVFYLSYRPSVLMRYSLRYINHYNHGFLYSSSCQKFPHEYVRSLTSPLFSMYIFKFSFQWLKQHYLIIF